MPLLAITNERLAKVEQKNFSTERVLQRLIEGNLQTVFGCRFVASEFSTGAQHAGRLDTLALSEDNNPVIIEYKKMESSELLTQSLFYLAWLHDHRGDFNIAVQKALGPKATVDWTDVRIICLAPNYSRYARYAVEKMGARIELWTYRFFENNTVYIEKEVLPYAVSSPTEPDSRHAVMVAAGKKAAITKLTGSYTFEQHLTGKPDTIRDIALAVEEFVMGLDPAVEEAPKKLYVAYKLSENIVCMEIQRSKIYLFLKLDPKKVAGPAGISRDVSNIGHFGTGDMEITLKRLQDVEASKPFIEMAFRAIGS
jgi:predicted transport protein